MKATTAEGVLERLKTGTGAGSDSSLAHMLGVSQQSISSARTKNRVPDSWVRMTAERFNLSTDWLFFGRKAVHQNDAQPLNEDSDIVWIPMVEAVLSAGNGSFETSDYSERKYAFRTDFISRKGNPKRMVLMRVAGNSMEPEVLHGDIVLIDQGKTNITPGHIFAVRFENSIYLKRIDTLPGEIILKSTNPEYPPLRLDVREQQDESVQIIGRVLWCGREYN